MENPFDFGEPEEINPFDFGDPVASPAAQVEETNPFDFGEPSSNDSAYQVGESEVNPFDFGEPEQPGLISDIAYQATSAANSGFAGIARAADTLFSDGVDGEFIQRLEANADYGQEQLSGRQKEANQKQFFSDKEDETFGNAWTDPRAITGLVADAAGSLVPMVVTGGPMSGALKTAAIKAGATQGGKVAATAAATGFGLAETGMVTGSVSGDIQQEINRMPNEIISTSPRYQELFQSSIQNGLDEQQADLQARGDLGRELGVEGMKDVAVPSLLLGTVAGNFMNKAISGKLAGSRFKNAGAGVLAEMPAEGGQGATEQFVKNVQLGQVDPNIQPFDNVLESGFKEGLGGGLMGASVGAVSRPNTMSDLDQTPSNELDVGPGNKLLSDAQDQSIDSNANNGLNRQDTVAQTESLNTDITRKNGQPFTTEKLAKLYAKNQPGIDEATVTPAKVDGGFVLRPIDQGLTKLNIDGTIDNLNNTKVNETTELIKNNFRHAKKLFENGRFKVVQSANELPENLAAQYAEGKRNPQGLYDIDTDVSYFVADALNKDNIKGAVLHETWHRTVATDKKLQAKLPELNKQLDSIYRHAQRGTGSLNKFYNQAVERMPANIPESQQLEEFAAYAIEQYTNDPKTLPAKVAQWVKDILANIRRGLLKGGAVPKNITPADLASIARSSFATNGGITQGTGQRFAYAGQQAKTANLSRLANAETLLKQGVPEEQVRQQTGWFKGLDGQPRFEIDDSNVIVKNPFLTKGQSFGDTLIDVQKGRFKDGQSFDISVSDFLDAPELFKAYPEIANIHVSDKKGTGGTYHPKSGTEPQYIEIGEDELMRDVKSALLHEVQHAIQTFEGFSRGGSPKDFVLSSKDKAYLKKVQDAKIIRQMSKDGNITRGIERFEKVFDSPPANGAVRLANESTTQELIKQYESLKEKDLDVLQATDKYSALAGEIEARDTQERLSLTPEQRAKSKPYSSQDTSNPIVKFGKAKAESTSAMKSVQANIRRGKAAMNKALLNKTSVNRAMHREGMGWVDFVWGDEGKAPNEKGYRKGGKGISHIIEARQRKDGLTEKESQELLFDLVNTISKGEEVSRFEFGKMEKVRIRHDNHLVALARKQGSNSWMVTGYEIDESDGGKTGNDVLPSTHNESTLTRNKVGADDSKITDSNGSSNNIRNSMTAEQFGIPFNELNPAEDSASRELFDTLVFKFQDKFHHLKRVQQEAVKNTGDELAESEDAYLAELRYHGQAGAVIEDFTNEHVDPLIEAISKTGLKIEDVDVYLHARHAPEANAQLRRINPGRENNESLSGMSDEYSGQVINSFTAEEQKVLEDIGNKVDGITKKTRDLLRTSGLEIRETLKAWEDTYQHYVPLHREGKGKRLSPKGRGFDTRGKTKRRAGSDRQVVNVLAHVVSQYEHTAIRSEKVKVGRAFLEFAENHPSDLWEVDKIEYAPTFNAEGLVSYRPDPSFQLADNVLIVKRNGKDHRITFDPETVHSQRIVHALKNLGASHSGAIVNVLSKFNRYLAAVNTSLNPEFIISNFSRDLQTATYNLSSTEADGLIGKVLRDVPRSFKGIRDYQKGKDTVWSKHFNEFRRAGAKTGWMEHYGNIEQREQNLQKKLDTMQDGKLATIKRGINAVGQFIEDENTAIENAVRLSAFVNARKKGISVAKSARLAKELTVNFNRKGDLGEVMNAMYLFYNAGIQGSVRLIESAHKSPKVRKMMVATVAFAVTLDMMNRAAGGLADDDEPYYDKIKPWIKDHNLIIMRENGKFFRIPLPWGFNTLHTLGQIIGEGIDKPNFESSKAAARFAGSVASAFNPIGGEHSLTQMLSPTITDALVQWDANENYAGYPIRPEGNPFDVEKPNSQQYFNSVREPSKWITNKLNDLTGGDAVRPGAIDISPEAIDLAYDNLTGGLGRFLGDSFTTPMKAFKGEKVEAHTIPLLRKVYSEPRETQAKSRYYEYMDNVRRTEQQWKFYATDPKKRQEIRKQYGEEVKLIAAAKTIKKSVRKLNKDKGLIELHHKTGKLKQDKIKRIDAATIRVMSRFNRLYYNRVVKGNKNDR